MKIWLKAAWFLGAAPLVVGVLIFLLWVLLRADVLMLAGIITICAGPAFIALGAICLVIYMWRWRRSKDIPRSRLIRQAAALAGLFLANFVIAGGFACSVIAIESSYSVSVTNQSPLTLKSARIYGGGVDIQLVDISSGSTVRKSFWINRDGTLMFDAECGPDKVSVTLDGYVTNGQGGSRAVTIDPSGQVTIREN